MTWKLTKHAQARMQQRGLRTEDVKVILEHGTEIAPGRYCLLRRDVRAQSDLASRNRDRIDMDEGTSRPSLDRLGQLVHRIVVAEGEIVITTLPRRGGRIRCDLHRRRVARQRARNARHHLVTCTDGGWS